MSTTWECLLGLLWFLAFNSSDQKQRTHSKQLIQFFSHWGFRICSCFQRRKSRSGHKTLVKFCAHGESRAFDLPPVTLQAVPHMQVGGWDVGLFWCQWTCSFQESIKRRGNNGGGLFRNAASRQRGPLPLLASTTLISWGQNAPFIKQLNCISSISMIRSAWLVFLYNSFALFRAQSSSNRKKFLCN